MKFDILLLKLPIISADFSLRTFEHSIIGKMLRSIFTKSIKIVRIDNFSLQKRTFFMKASTHWKIDKIAAVAFLPVIPVAWFFKSKITDSVVAGLTCYHMHQWVPSSFYVDIYWKYVISVDCHKSPWITFVEFQEFANSSSWAFLPRFSVEWFSISFCMTIAVWWWRSRKFSTWNLHVSLEIFPTLTNMLKMWKLLRCLRMEIAIVERLSVATTRRKNSTKNWKSSALIATTTESTPNIFNFSENHKPTKFDLVEISFSLTKR